MGKFSKFFRSAEVALGSSLGWREIRGASITKEERDIFEMYGENVIQMLLVNGANDAIEELKQWYGRSHGQFSGREKMKEWLKERGDIRERHEQRIEFLEWAILLFVALGVVVETMQLIRHI
jgi:hypothetical protein